MYAATWGPNVKWGGTYFKWGAGHHWPPSWRWPWFVYLGTVLNNKLDLSPDVQRRVRLASSAFGRLSQRVFFNRNLYLKTKMAVCVSTLLYGCEAWVLYRRHIKTLEQFHISCLQRMLRLHWRDKVPDVEIRHRGHCLSLEAIIAERQLRWTEHVIRMPESRLPCA